MSKKSEKAHKWTSAELTLLINAVIDARDENLLMQGEGRKLAPPPHLAEEKYTSRAAVDGAEHSA